MRELNLKGNLSTIRQDEWPSNIHIKGFFPPHIGRDQFDFGLLKANICFGIGFERSEELPWKCIRIQSSILCLLSNFNFGLGIYRLELIKMQGKKLLFLEFSISSKHGGFVRFVLVLQKSRARFQLSNIKGDPLTLSPRVSQLSREQKES